MYPPPPRAAKNEMLIFGLHSTSDDRPSNLEGQKLPKMQKMAAKSPKMKCSFLHYIQSNETHPKCKKNGCQTVK